MRVRMNRPGELIAAPFILGVFFLGERVGEWGTTCVGKQVVVLVVKGGEDKRMAE